MIRKEWANSEGNRMYIVIFLLSYLLSFVCLFLWARAGSSPAVRRLRQHGADERKIADFRRKAAPLSMLIEPTLISGTILGTFISLVFWGRGA